MTERTLPERLREIAIALLSVCDVCDKHPDASEEWAREYFDKLENSEHDGDCTKRPYTCSRCLCDEYKQDARAILPLLDKIFAADAVERAQGVDGWPSTAQVEAACIAYRNHGQWPFEKCHARQKDEDRQFMRNALLAASPPPTSTGWSEGREAAARVADTEAREGHIKAGRDCAEYIASAIRSLTPPEGSADGWGLPPEFGERVAIIKAWDGWPYHLYCADYSRRWPDPVLVEKAYAEAHKCAACRQPLLPSPPASG